MYGERIKFLRKDTKTTQAELAHYLGFKSPSAIGMVERNERELSFEMLSQVATYFKVSTDYLLGRTESVICPECGTEYSPLYDESCDEHNIIHNNYINFKEKDKLIDYSNAERIKEKCRTILKSNEFSIDEKYKAAIEYFRCYFSRSVISSLYSPRHVSFSEFVAMLLNQKSGPAHTAPPEVFKALVKHFGQKEGIPDGKSYAPLKKIETNNSKDLTKGDFFMTKYERLLTIADDLGYVVREFDLLTRKGHCKNNRIAINKNILTNTEKACILLEEINHGEYTVGDITDQSKVENIKQELFARAKTIESLCSLDKIVDAVNINNATNKHEIIEILEVTEELFNDAIKYYSRKCPKYIKDSVVLYFDGSELFIYKEHSMRTK